MLNPITIKLDLNIWFVFLSVGDAHKLIDELTSHLGEVTIGFLENHVR